MYVVLQSQQIPADQLLTSTVSSLMGEMVASALAQEGVSRLSSFISTMLDDRVSRAHMLARLLARLERALHVGKRVDYASITTAYIQDICE